jgi:hypothetical protein
MSAELRHPEKNSLLALRFDYQTQAFGSVRATADHEAGEIVFRAANLRGFEVVHKRHPPRASTLSCWTNWPG